MEEMKKKGNVIALLPIGVFLVLYLGLGILFEYVMKIPMGFYNVPIVVAFLSAILVACVQNRTISFDRKLELMAKGVGDKNIITMLLIFLTAGSFVGVVGRSSAESVAYCMLSLIPARFSVAVLFVVACFVSVAMGTSVGTITLLTPIAVAVSKASGFDMAFCVASVMGGAMFGDNLSFISDTTIAACNGQGCQMKDKFRENFWIAFPAALVTLGLILVLSLRTDLGGAVNHEYHLIQMVPYILVLIGGIIGINVFLVLIGGTVISLIAGVATGNIVLADMFTVVGDGVVSMYDITVISILVACIVSLVKMNGGIQFILDQIKSRIHGAKGAQGGIALLSFLVDLCTANNTVAIVMTGPIAKEISDEFDVDPRRSASLLDMFTSVGQGLIPYGAQLLTAAALTGLTPFDFMPYLIYPMLMAVCGIVAICIRRERKSA
mgnify:CR=1 FL=1